MEVRKLLHRNHAYTMIMFSLLLFMLLLLSSVSVGWPLQDVFQRQTVTAPSKFIFIFGDSYTATGFSTTTQPQPSVSNPLGNPPLPGARLSGGDIWIDTVMKNFTRKGTVAYDFAVGGNPVNSSRTQDPNPTGDFRAQLSGFEKSIGVANSGKVKWQSGNTLFVNWFGINDVAIQAFNGRNYSTATAILGPDVADYFGLLERQWQLGGRNFVTVLVPPIRRAGAFGWGTYKNAPDVDAFTTYWNSQIVSANSRWQKSHPSSTSRIVDPTDSFNTILNNPAQYGAPNATCWSYGKGQPCLWHDFLHPGIVIHAAFGRQMGELVRSMGF